MIATYWKHSGFSVRTENHLLVFDYIGGGMPAPTAEDRAAIFVSHAHRDHCDPTVRSWPGLRADGAKMKSGDTVEGGGVRARAYPSTDEGVSFLVEADGARIFHAGDLNFWSWRAESTPEEVREAEAAFERALSELEGERIDLAFFPVDPRLGNDCAEGALRFAEKLRPSWLVPMHFWDHPETALAFAKLPMPEGVRAAALTRSGESILV